MRNHKNQKSTFILALLGLLFYILFGFNSFSQAESSANIFNKIQTTFDQLTDLHANLTQTNTDTSSKVSTTYTGEVYFQKPNKLRIEYSKPNEQSMVFDGEYLWIYTAELKQITKQKLESGAVPVPLLFFAGASQIDQEEFRKKNWINPIKLETVSGMGTYRIRMKPKSKSAVYVEQSFWVNTTTLLPVKARILDTNGIMVSVTFSEVEKDCGIPSEKFALSIPAGVECIDLTQ